MLNLIAQDQTQFKEIWAIREGITECLAKDGFVYKYDIRYFCFWLTSLPLPILYDLVLEVKKRLGDLKLFGFPDSQVKNVVGYGVFNKLI